MDLDVDVANVGDRVGLAMRTAGPFREDLLGKGSILADSNERFIVESKSKFDLDKAAFQKNELAAGDVVHLCSDLQFVVGRISEVSDCVYIDWDFPIVLNNSSTRNPLIIQLEANPRIMGFAKFK
jgi:selenocysteine-specific translation elongation factor